MALPQRRKKRERFLPFAYRRGGLELVVSAVQLDGGSIDRGIDRERRLVALEEYAWEQAQVEVALEVPPDLLATVLCETERAEPPVDLLLVLRSPETWLRRPVRLWPGPLRAGKRRGSLALDRAELGKAATLTAFLVRSGDSSQREPGYAWVAGSRLASAHPWEIRCEPRPVPPGRFLDVRYRSFAEDEVLGPLAANLYRLELDQEEPVLWINTDHRKLTPIFSDQGSTGKRARLRELFYDAVAYGVWSQLFVRAAEDLRTEGEASYDWQDAVLQELLPLMVPGRRSHADRVAAFRQVLQREGLAALMERLDAALQHKSELCRHMTRLVEETLERGR